MEFPRVPGSGADLGTVDLIQDGQTLFMRSPAFSDIAQGSTQWIKIDFAKLNPSLADISTLSSSRSDPTQALEYLRGMGAVEKIGTDRIDGTATTHYRGTVDLNKAVANAPTSSRATLRSLANQFEQLSGSASFPEDVWIDSEQRVRRMEFALRLSDPKAGTLRMLMRMDLSDFGVDVDVEPPPADQVTDISELAGNGTSP